MDKGRRLAILIIRAKSNRLIDILPHVEACLSIMNGIQPGEVVRDGETGLDPFDPLRYE